jgi:hypothetical protein
MVDRMSKWITTGERPALPVFVSSFAKGAPSGGLDDDDDADDDDEDDDDDDDDDPDADKTDDELRAELKSTRDALAKANGQSAKRRRALRQREAELEEARKPKTPKPATDDGKVDVDEIRTAALREGEKAGITRAKKAEARAALLGAGVTSDRVAKAVGLLDLDELDLDDDGLDGIDDEIETLRKTWPELFARPRQRRQSVIGQADRDGSGSTRKTQTASEKAAAQLLGR